MIKLCVYVTDNCIACKRVVEMLKEFSNAEPNIQFTIVDVKNKNTTRRVSIVPAVFLNDKLYSFGDINKNDLRKKVYQLSRKY